MTAAVAGKVYVSGALMNVPDLGRVRRLYTEFAGACHDASWTPYLPHSSTDPELASAMTPETVMSKDLGELDRADVVLAYIGEPSLGVGAEIAIAISRGKKILAIYESGRRVSRFVLGLLHEYRSAAIYEFESESEACAWITKSLAELRPALSD